MTNYRRYRIKGGTCFFTVNLQDRRSDLLTKYIETLRQALHTVKTHHPFTIDAMAVLPDHLHCIFTLPEYDNDYSLRWRQIKSAFSRHLPKTEPRSQSRINKHERGIWQRRFWEHVIRDGQDFRTHVDYIHFNPVKHGLVDQVIKWPYSSFHKYVERSIYPHDWGSGQVMESMPETGERV